MTSNTDQAPQTLVEHLADLRSCLIKSLFIVSVGFVLCIYFSEMIFEFVRAPIAPYLPSGGLVFTAPIDKFISHLKVSFLAGVIITCPIWLYQVWIFIAPGLYRNERRYAVAFIIFGSVLFLVGVLFVYKLVFPMAFKYLLTFGGETDTPMITITEYLGFFITTTLVFGLVFELPLILVMMGMLGIVDADFLRSKRRIAIVVLALVAAIVTPPDAVSMLAMLVPMSLLYEISIILVAYFGRKRAVDADITA